MAGDLAALSLGSIVYQGSRLVVNLAAAAYLGPSGFGMWIVIALVIQYASFVSLGVPVDSVARFPSSLAREHRSRPTMPRT